jgi:ATP-dependent Lon protease
MTFKGRWLRDVFYKKGEIITVYGKNKKIEYYICNQDNKSKHPSKNSIEWSKTEYDIHVKNIKRTFSDPGPIPITITISDADPDTEAEPSTPVLPAPKTPLMPFILFDDILDAIEKELEKEIEKEIEIKDPVVKILSEQELVAQNERTKLKRKLDNISVEIDEYKQKKNNNNALSIYEQLLLLDVDMETKIHILDKYDNIKRNTMGSEYAKGMTWINTVLNVPFNKYVPFEVTNSDPKEKLKTFFEKVKSDLDDSIHGLDYVKEEILEYLARKVSNDKSKGHILALHGSAGTGKTKIISSLGKALNLPFYQINCGGLNDVAILTGHSETYLGSKPGKLIEIISNAGCMNPIIYLDEIDKINETKSKEINGLLTHLLDEEQNNKFQDNYLANINIDLSQVLFVIAFNHLDKVDPIVMDRMKVIHIQNPNLQDKITIIRDKILPTISQHIPNKVIIEDDLISYVITTKTQNEIGVRQIKKAFEKIINKLNYQLLIGDIIIENDQVHITKQFIDSCLKSVELDDKYHFMYM